MDPRLNPYAPGAGTPPPELAGRDDLLERASVALDRIRAGRPARSVILYGLRGVGKTVLLNRMRQSAEADRITCVRMEAVEERSLPSLLVPALRAALLRLDRSEAAVTALAAATRALAGFAKALKLKYHDIEFGVDLDGPAATGDLNTDLTDLMTTLGQVAHGRKTAVALFIDELQYVPEDQLAALIGALHTTAQLSLPVTLVGAGLPQLLGRTGRARSYAERLFEFSSIDRLSDAAARDALTVPAEKQDIRFEPAAVAEILRQTQGYPYFLQEWGKHCWDVAETSPITEADARLATRQALADLDASFFRVRFDRLTPAEKAYLRMMADLGPGPHRSGDVAAKLGRKVTAVAPIRSELMVKGMIYSPAHGDTAFTVPLFDTFMRRTLPEGY